MTNLPWATRNLPDAHDALAPDTSEVRILAESRRASMVHCTLGPGKVSAAVRHRTVEEIWYFLRGRGELWRRSHGTDAEEVVPVEAGISITLPVGTEFQFRATGTEPLVFLCCTIPPWPGEDEAVVVRGHWPSDEDAPR